LTDYWLQLKGEDPLGIKRSSGVATHLFTRYLRPQWKWFGLLAFLLVGTSAAALLPPQILRAYIDLSQASKETGGLVVLSLCYLGGVVLTIAFTVGSNILSEYIGWTAMNDLRADLVQHCIELDISFHHAHTPGELIERIDGDVATLANFFSRFLLLVASNILLLAGILLLLLFESWQLGVAFLFFVAVTLVCVGKVRDLALPHWQATRAASAAFFGFLEERLASCEDIRSLRAVSYVMRQFTLLLRRRFELERKAGLMGSVLGVTAVGLFTIGYALAFAFSASLFVFGAVTLGTVYLIYQYIQLSESPLLQITAQLGDFQQADASIVRIKELLQVQRSIKDGCEASLPAGPLTLDFRDVHFSYVQENPVLRGVTFHLEAGHVLGILGRTGSGKSTLARLLFRLYDPTSGTIALSGIDIRKLSLADLRSHIGLVTQEVQFFHATLRDNLTFFDRSIPDERIIDVLDDLEMGSWYRALPAGLDTWLSAGKELSAGEAQIVAFARVFLKDPAIVILDEASSRLDPATEQRIERAVDKLLHNRTGILIAHRLATIQRTDTLLILENGSICELGAREALQHDPMSRLSQLLCQQKEEISV
jgi:ATP-binding cassette subfamily B protein